MASLVIAKRVAATVAVVPAMRAFPVDQMIVVRVGTAAKFLVALGRRLVCRLLRQPLAAADARRVGRRGCLARRRIRSGAARSALTRARTLKRVRVRRS